MQYLPEPVCQPNGVIMGLEHITVPLYGNRKLNMLIREVTKPGKNAQLLAN